MSSSHLSKAFLEYVHEVSDEKFSSVIQFFDHGDYYSCHAEDAVFVAKEIWNEPTALKSAPSAQDEKNRFYLTLNRTQFECLVQDLLIVRHYSVEVFCSEGAGKSSRWELKYRGSPGDLSQFEDILSNAALLNYVGNGVGVIACCGEFVKDSNMQFSFAYSDGQSMKLIIGSHSDTDQLVNLESVVVQLGPSEMLAPAALVKSDMGRRLQQLCSRSNVLLSERPASTFVHDGTLISNLRRIASGDTETQLTLSRLESSENKSCLPALAAVSDFYKLFECDEAMKYEIRSMTLAQYVSLNTATFYALNIFPSPAAGGNPSARSSSLFGVLNYCRTAAGQRLLAQWLRQPLRDPRKIAERLDIVEALVRCPELRQALCDDCLAGSVDFSKLSRKFAKKTVTLQDIYKAYQTLSRLPTCVNSLQSLPLTDSRLCTLVGRVFIQPLSDTVVEFSKLMQMVEETLDFERVDAGEFLIRAEFDDELREYRDQMDKRLSEMRSVAKSAANDLELEFEKTVRLEHVPHLGYVMRMSRKDEKQLRNNSTYQVVDATKGAGIRFSTRRLQALSDAWSEIYDSYVSHQSSVVQEVVAVASGYADAMMRLCCIIAEFDVFYSLANACVEAPGGYVRPILLDCSLADGNKTLNFKDLRHPCLELQDRISFIPNDVDLNEKSFFVVLTGPNMGGKSTYIRSIGCAVLMAQIGCFVPAAQAELTVVDAILTRVGGGENLNKGVSTFMKEMLDTAAILQSATANSLVIIDELGRGTSTYDGCGLAWSISEHLLNTTRCRCLFATHFNELTSLEDEFVGAHNMHVTALIDGDSLTLLYKVKPGPCDRSFGIHVAEMTGFPGHVVEAARVAAAEFERDQAYCAAVGKRFAAADIHRGNQLALDALCSGAVTSPSDATEMLHRFRLQFAQTDNPYLQELVNRFA